MAKWKELPTDPAELQALYEKLKDKEMRLEADLAIKEYPEIEEIITKVALGLADVKKLDDKIQKATKPEDPEERKQIEALVNRRQHLQQQLDLCEAQIKEKGGKEINKLIELKQQRDLSFDQLASIYTVAHELLGDHELRLATVLPSITDFIAVPTDI